MEDNRWMQLAIQEGAKGRLNAPPNPWVGCVIVKEGRLISEGHHPECGQPHAEVFALKDAGESAAGATAYVTLEPCSHFGRTPPCVQALKQSKVSRVVVGIEDPDPQVAGKGIKALKEAGIQVDVGIEKEAVERSLTSYLHHRRTGKPYVIAKSAVSIDGKVAAENGSSRWISCKEARLDAHALRAESQAILVGSGTAIADSPQLTVRHPSVLPKQQPLRVVLDRSGKIPHTSPLFDSQIAPTLLFSERNDAPKGIERLFPCTPDEILNFLGKRGVLQLLIEGGPKVLSEFLKENCIDELCIYMGPKILGNKGLDVFDSLGIQAMDQAHTLKVKNIKQLNDTVKVTYLRS